jgi:hypothetical protein
MLFEPDREALRMAWARAWQRHRTGLPLQPLEAAVADVVAEHPEYHDLLESVAGTPGDAGNEALSRTWTPADGEANPFLHMSLHLALREQASTDRPHGIRALRQKLSRSAGSLHAAEHGMMEVLGRILWEAQRDGRPPDERAYLDALRKLAGA